MKKALVVLFSLACGTQSFGEDLRTEEIEFVSHGVTLSGSIVIPASDIHSAVVFVHGSGKQSRDLNLAERFAKAGIAALVYDKRGAGKSGGEYEGNQNVSEENIALLADDAAAALKALASHPLIKGSPVGGAEITQRKIHLARLSRQRHRCEREPGKAVDPRPLDLQRQRLEHPGGPVDRQPEKAEPKRASL